MNLAAVHYHFGSKDSLVQKVFERRIRPVNARRLALLDKAEDAAAASGLELEPVLRAFIEPAIRLYAQDPKGPVFMSLIENQRSILLMPSQWNTSGIMSWNRMSWTPATHSVRSK